MKNLINEIKQIKGSILGIHVTEEKIKKAIYQNDKIYKCDLLEEENTKKSNGKQKTANNTIPIRKLGKIYKKKKVDYLLCNINSIEKYMPYIWKDAFQISKKGLYIYGNMKEEEKEKIEKRYPKQEKKEEGKYTFYYIQKQKIPKYKKYFYFIVDQINLFLDKITEILEQ